MFVPEEVISLAREVLDTTLGQATYQASKVTQWTETLIDEVLKRLVALKKPYKYLVTCALLQRMGAGLHASTAEYWDAATDGHAHITWENRTIYCMMTVFGLSI
ncbi:Dynein light chain [Giardia muris]|uniref:Dynein light chain n=1 Tax=Giardia muris TaxID=5742 RepID=A0A4Z1SNT5_GIAMU|nr:Dynein light chain [Giardia muris]|eukprot:TNJ27446.1 Dynein light chain [Giardia muris]